MNKLLAVIALAVVTLLIASYIVLAVFIAERAS